MRYLSAFFFLCLCPLLCMGCQTEKGPVHAASTGEVAPAVLQSQSAHRSLPVLTVLPVSFSPESQRNYPEWIAAMPRLDTAMPFGRNLKISFMIPGGSNW